MKKLFKLLPMLAIVVGLGLSAFTGTKAKSTTAQPKAGEMYWYPVSSDGSHTISDEYLYFDTKANVIAAQSCKDISDLTCLLGSEDEALPENTSTSTAPSAAKIRRN